MLQAAAPYARWIDVFCEPHSTHAFDAEEAREVLKAGAAAGLGLRVHANQLGRGPGVQLAVEHGAASVDHCTYLGYADVDALAAAADTTVATLLPGVEFCTRSPYPDADRLLTAGASIALATDCNPGTCYSSSMPWVISLAVREMGLTPAQALLAATAGSASHCGVPTSAASRSETGPISQVLDAPSYLHLAYRPECRSLGSWMTNRACRPRRSHRLDPEARRLRAPLELHHAWMDDIRCSAYLEPRIELDGHGLEAAAHLVGEYEEIWERQGQSHARDAVVESRPLAVRVLEDPERDSASCGTGDCLVHLAYEAEPEWRRVVVENRLQCGSGLEGPASSPQCARVTLPSADQEGDEGEDQRGDRDQDDHAGLLTPRTPRL
jgi:hypothetical protein